MVHHTIFSVFISNLASNTLFNLLYIYDIKKQPIINMKDCFISYAIILSNIRKGFLYIFVRTASGILRFYSITHNLSLMFSSAYRLICYLHQLKHLYSLCHLKQMNFLYRINYYSTNYCFL